MWRDIPGQPLAVRMLKAHVMYGRVAQAYLFAGPEGVGKERVAMELAKALNCLADGDRPCDDCDPCGRIARKTHPDVHWVAPQGAAALIRIEDIRQVLERTLLRPFMARTQVAIIDGADRLTEEAANSLLKSLEEPSSLVRFVLLTTQLGACLPTIVSRCQVVRFQRLNGMAPEDQPIEEAMRAQLDSDDAASWARWQPPTDRKELLAWLDGSIRSLRRRAHLAIAEPDAYIRSGFRVIELRMALEHMANARLIGALLREEWLKVLNA